MADAGSTGTGGAGGGAVALPPQCIDCGGPVSRKSKGRCRPCAAREIAARPASKAKISAALKLRWASDPDYAARQTAHLAAVALSSEEKSRRFIEARMWERGVAARWAAAPPGSAARARAGARIRAAKLSHIPADYRAEYRQLVKRGHRAADAERMIRDLAEAERVRFIREINR